MGTHQVPPDSISNSGLAEELDQRIWHRRRSRGSQRARGQARGACPGGVVRDVRMHLAWPARCIEDKMSTNLAVAYFVPESCT